MSGLRSGSGRIHSAYERTLLDLPSQGQVVRIRLRTRRFRCVLAACRQRIFTERLAAASGRPFARRTTRLEGIVHHLGLALGGRPGQALRGGCGCRSAGTPCCASSASCGSGRGSACGAIDWWAFKRGLRYGTIVCDLERRRVIDLLPDREAATVAEWLAARPSVEIIARDRGAGYIQAATVGRPAAIQVADRWHLMENASAAFLSAVQRSMQAIRKALGGAAVDPAALSCAERRQHSGWLRREAENAAILTLARQGTSIKEIVRQTGKSRGWSARWYAAAEPTSSAAGRVRSTPS